MRMVPESIQSFQTPGRQVLDFSFGKGRSISSEFPPSKIEAPIKKILRRLRGLISRIRPWPIHVACLTLTNVSDIYNWFAGIAISPLSYYRCRDNLYQVRTIVDYQIRWSAIFTLAHKLKSSARNIIPKYSKDLNNIVTIKTQLTPNYASNESFRCLSGLYIRTNLLTQKMGHCHQKQHRKPLFVFLLRCTRFYPTTNSI